MGALGILAAAAKSCPVSPAGRCNRNPETRQKALWRGPVVSCCGVLAVMAQEANSWDPGSIPGRDTSFDVPESSCLLSTLAPAADSNWIPVTVAILRKGLWTQLGLVAVEEGVQARSKRLNLKGCPSTNKQTKAMMKMADSCRNQPSGSVRPRPPCMVSNFDQAKARAQRLPSIGKEGADCRSKGISWPMGDHGILGSLRRAFSPLWRLSTSL